MHPSKIYRRSTQGGEGQNVFRPQLTSLIDVMTFLLLFLIKSFSVQGDIITPSSNLELPMSATSTPPKVVTTIEISKTGIVADGKQISTLNAADSADALMLPAVYRWVAGIVAQAAVIQPREIMIQADRGIEFSVLKRVMYSCSKAGCTNFTILAMQKE
jgi:biopolymer transport protein ExbD